jgi:hypothetical protein
MCEFVTSFAMVLDSIAEEQSDSEHITPEPDLPTSTAQLRGHIPRPFNNWSI